MGATGATGGALLRRLSALGIPCRAVTRTPDSLRAALGPARPPVEIAGADAADPRSLRAAFSGTTQLFLTMANGPRQTEYESTVVDAAAASGVRHVVKLSAPAAEPDSPVAVSRGHWHIENRLAATGMVSTVLRPYAFFQKLLLSAPAIAEGVLIGSLGGAPCNYIDVRDIADAAAAILLRPALAGGRHILTGPRAWTQPELARLLSGLTGHPVRVIDLPPAAFHEHLVRTVGLPGWLAGHVVEIQQLAAARPESPNGTVEALLGRPARALDAFVRENLPSFQSRAPLPPLSM